jgi:hypothetical protein
LEADFGFGNGWSLLGGGIPKFIFLSWLAANASYAPLRFYLEEHA